MNFQNNRLLCTRNKSSPKDVWLWHICFGAFACDFCAASRPPPLARNPQNATHFEDFHSSGWIGGSCGGCRILRWLTDQVALSSILSSVNLSRSTLPLSVCVHTQVDMGLLLP